MFCACQTLFVTLRPAGPKSVPVLDDWFRLRRQKEFEKLGVVGSWELCGPTAKGRLRMMSRSMSLGATREGATHESATSLNCGKTSLGPWSGSRGRRLLGVDVTTMGFVGDENLQKGEHSPSRLRCVWKVFVPSMELWPQVLKVGCEKDRVVMASDRRLRFGASILRCRGPPRPSMSAPCPGALITDPKVLTEGTASLHLFGSQVRKPAAPMVVIRVRVP